MPKIEVFNLQDGKELHVIQNRTNILMELHNWPDNIEGQHLRGWIELNFQKQDDERYYQVINEMANKVWNNINIKEADNYGNDYDEYYDRSLDNNGGLRIVKLDDGHFNLKVSQVFAGSPRVYQFNKQKVGTFIYDLNQHKQ